MLLSGYRMMWTITMFDLPVGTKAERKAAHDFRETLLDLGYEMAQFSVYMRYTGSAQQIQTYLKAIKAALPEGGSVMCLQITDKQYEKMVVFENAKPATPKNIPEQYSLF